jgi:hypothetical protein
MITRADGPVLSERMITRVEGPFVRTPAVDFRAIPDLTDLAPFMFRRSFERVSARSKVPNARAHHVHPFGAKQLTLQPGVSSIAAEPPGGGDHAVAGDVSEAAPAHDVAHCPGRPRMSRGLCDVAVRRNAARRNSPDHGQNAACEGHRSGASERFHHRLRPCATSRWHQRGSPTSGGAAGPISLWWTPAW